MPPCGRIPRLATDVLTFDSWLQFLADASLTIDDVARHMNSANLKPLLLVRGTRRLIR